MNKITNTYITILLTVSLVFSIGCEESSDGAAQSNTKLAANSQSDTTAPFVASIDKIYDSLLKEVVTTDGLVRYDLLLTPKYKDKLNEVVTGYAKAELKGSKNAQLAILCNAYNANVIKQIIDRLETDQNSVNDISGFFDKNKIIVGSLRMALNDLENKYIRTKGDPRTHAALVCGAMGCPPLRNEPFTAEKLNDQLDSQCSTWVNDKAKFKVKDQELRLSKIMKWYEGDFEISPYENAVDFVRKFANKNTDSGKFLADKTNTQVETFYMDYDWNLNRAPKPK